MDNLSLPPLTPERVTSAFDDLIKHDASHLESLRAQNGGGNNSMVINRTLDYTYSQAGGIRVGVVIFPGTLDDRDAARAVRLAGARVIALWHGDESLQNVDAVVIPGGFSYGDYLRAGAIARFAKVMEKVKDAAKGGMPVLGICNGFQILTESHMLPGALVRNANQKFTCKEQDLVVANNATAWTNCFETSEAITIPLKNGQGRFVADKKTLDKIEAQGQVVFRYGTKNPNGSQNDIAGICNEKGNVVGLMPHPEHAVEEGFGVDKGDTFSVRAGTDGIRFFQSLVAGILKEDLRKFQAKGGVL